MVRGVDKADAMLTLYNIGSHLLFNSQQESLKLHWHLHTFCPACRCVKSSERSVNSAWSVQGCVPCR